MSRKTAVYKEGYLLKESRYIKTFRKRYIVLKDDRIYSYKTKRSQINPTEILHLRNCNNIKKQTNKFALLFPNETRWFMMIHKKNDLNKWVDKIQKNLQSIKINNSIKTNDKQQSSNITHVSSKFTTFSSSICKSVKYCKCIKRIFSILQYYYCSKYNENYLAKRLIKYDNLMDDYNHILIHHLCPTDENEKHHGRNSNFNAIYQIMDRNNLFCNINECDGYQGIERETLSIYMDILNSMQCYIISSVLINNIDVNGINENIINATEIFYDNYHFVNNDPYLCILRPINEESIESKSSESEESLRYESKSQSKYTMQDSEKSATFMLLDITDDQNQLDDEEMDDQYI